MADLSPNVLAALEYTRRFQKGLPSDRWCDGHAGAVKVAKGIEELATAVLRYMDEEERRGTDSMEAHADPMR